MQNDQFVQYSENHGENILYKPSKKVEVSEIKSDRVQTLVTGMHTKMKEVGIGLAANQVGEPIQLFMIEFNNIAKRYKNLKMDDVPFQVFINPKITQASAEKVAFWHGCLSATDKPLGKVATYQWIDYEALDERGNLKRGRLKEMAAIIFQHEFRHLLGQCYLDFAKEFIERNEYRRKVKNEEIKVYDAASGDDPLLLSNYHVGDTIEEYAAKLK